MSLKYVWPTGEFVFPDTPSSFNSQPANQPKNPDDSSLLLKGTIATYSPARPSAYRPKRAYVERCGQGTLLTFKDGKVSGSALRCKSWACDSCRRALAADLLHRFNASDVLNDESKKWHLITFTIDPKLYGAVRIGSYERDGKQIAMYSEPSEKQFKRAARAMAKEWKRFNDRLRIDLARRGYDKKAYFRVVELHRNGWPHYHALLGVDAGYGFDALLAKVRGWALGRNKLQAIHNKDDAFGEVMPYLVSKESTSHKAYQFSGVALPEGFRIWSSSRGLLPDKEVDSVDDGFAVGGHFSSWRESFDGSMLALNPPSDGEHRPPAKFVANTDLAVAMYAQVRDLDYTFSDLRSKKVNVNLSMFRRDVN